MTRTIKRTEIEMDRHPESGIGVMRTPRGILPLKSLDVRAQIFGLGSKSVIRQTFFNNYDEPIEATYIFPLPGRDAVTKFVMHVNGRQIEGELQERGQAREVYDKAIQAGHAAAIAEEDRSETFTMRVGNIPPGEEVSIEMTLVGQLPIAGDEASFRFPLVVAPRYISGSPLDGESVGDGTACDTNRVPDASRITPPVLISGMPNPVQLSVEVDIHLPESFDRDQLLSQLSSSLHTVVVNEAGVADGLPLKVRLQPGERMNRDFILRFPFLAEKNSCSLLAAKDGFGGSVFSVNIVPPEASSTPRAPRDVVFVLDRSGSMGGWKMVAARRAVARMIDTMRDVDRFSVMAFDTSIEFPENAKRMFQAGTDRNRWESLQWVSTVEARGGTKLERATIEAIQLHQNKGRRDCEPVIVLITDGQVGAEDAVLKLIETSSDTCKPTFFCLGIDKAVNHGFLTRIAKRTSGTCETIESEDQLDKAMDRFHKEIGSPVLTDVRIKGQGLKLGELTPFKKINVFPDRPISIFGIAENAKADFDVTVTGKLQDGRTWETTVTAKQADPETLHALWGRERLRDLEDDYVSHSSSSLQKQIIAVSLKSNVLCRFTSYVAVDRTRVINEGEQPHKVVQPVEQVEESMVISAWSQPLGEAVFGRAAQPAKYFKQQSAMRVKRKSAPSPRRRSGRGSNQDLGIVPPSPAAQTPSDFDCDSLEILEDSANPIDALLGGAVGERGGIAGASDNAKYLDDLELDDIAFFECESIPPSMSDTSSEFDDTSIGFAETIDDQSARASLGAFGEIMEGEAGQRGASAIVIQVLKKKLGRNKLQVDFVVNGVSQPWDRYPMKTQKLICDAIVAMCCLDASENQLPQIGNWTGASGINWRVLTFPDKDGNRIILMSDLAKSAPLSLVAIKNQVEVNTMLGHYPWLRSLLDSICESFNSNSDSTERTLMLAKAEPWLAMLAEVKDKFSGSQANVISRMETAFREAILSWKANKPMKTINVLKEMIDVSNGDVSNGDVSDKERKAFWS